MINDVLYNICELLKNHFGYNIYIDKVEQDFFTPAFLIKVIDLSGSRLLTNERRPQNKKNTISLSITYFPDETSEEIAEDLQEKAEDIFYLLDLLEGGTYRTRLRDSKTQFIDNTLIMVLNYDLKGWVYKSSDEDSSKMYNLINTDTTKEV